MTLSTYLNVKDYSNVLKLYPESEVEKYKVLAERFKYEYNL